MDAQYGWTVALPSVPIRTKAEKARKASFLYLVAAGWQCSAELDTTTDSNLFLASSNLQARLPAATFTASSAPGKACARLKLSSRQLKLKLANNNLKLERELQMKRITNLTWPGEANFLPNSNSNSNHLLLPLLLLLLEGRNNAMITFFMFMWSKREEKRGDFRCRGRRRRRELLCIQMRRLWLLEAYRFAHSII